MSTQAESFPERKLKTVSPDCNSYSLSRKCLGRPQSVRVCSVAQRFHFNLIWFKFHNILKGVGRLPREGGTQVAFCQPSPRQEGISTFPTRSSKGHMHNPCRARTHPARGTTKQQSQVTRHSCPESRKPNGEMQGHAH